MTSLPSNNRSRSLDGLLDSTEAINSVAIANNAKDEQITPSTKEATNSCDDYYDNLIKKQTDDVVVELDDVVAKCADSDNIDKVSIQSNSSDSKRKRNFMDRCVNKVRSLIKK